MATVTNNQGTTLVSGITSSQLAVGRTVFGGISRPAGGVIRSTATGILSVTKIYTWPEVETILDSDRLKILAYLAVLGTSDDDVQKSWASWTFSMITLAFPEMEGLIRAQGANEYKFVPLPKETINTILTSVATAMDDAASDEDYEATIPLLSMPVDFPVQTDPAMFPRDLVCSASVAPIYGFIGLLIFLAGKRITVKNATTITERRPSNVIAAYSIAEDARHFLTGDQKMRTQAHTFVHQAWITCAMARRAIIIEVASFIEGASLPQRVVFTLAKMLEFTQMQSAYFINKFLSAFPEATLISSVAPSLQVYIQSNNEVIKAPVHLRPFHKLIYGDSTRVYHRNAIVNLAACAVAYEKLTSPSMANYSLGVGASAAVALYDAEAASLGFKTIQGASKAVVREVEEE